jgi:hypothetical protein
MCAMVWSCVLKTASLNQNGADVLSQHMRELHTPKSSQSCKDPSLVTFNRYSTLPIPWQPSPTCRRVSSARTRSTERSAIATPTSVVSGSTI